jgi:hypothetical protein
MKELEGSVGRCSYTLGHGSAGVSAQHAYSLFNAIGFGKAVWPFGSLALPIFAASPIFPL